MADTLEKKGGWHSPPDNGKLPGTWKQPENPVPAESLAAQEQPTRPDPPLAPDPETAGHWYLPPDTIYAEKEPEVAADEVIEPVYGQGPQDSGDFTPPPIEIPAEPVQETPVEPEIVDTSLFDESRSGALPGIGVAEPDSGAFDEARSGVIAGIGNETPEPDAGTFDEARSGMMPGLQSAEAVPAEEPFDNSRSGALPGIGSSTEGLEASPMTAPASEPIVEPQSATQASTDTGALAAQESMPMPQQPDKFADVETKVSSLREQFMQGKISRQQLQDELRRLMILDEYGRWWMLGLDTNKWYRYDGKDWIPDTPPRPQAANFVPTETGVQQVISQPEQQPTSAAGTPATAESEVLLPNKVPVQDLGATLVGQGAMNFDVTRPSEAPTVPGMTAPHQPALEATLPSATVPNQGGQQAAIPGAYPNMAKGDEDSPRQLQMTGIQPDYSEAFSGYFDRANMQKWGLRTVIFGGVGALMLAFIAVIVMVLAYFAILSDYRQAITDLENRVGSFQTTVLYDGNGDVLAEFSDPREGARKSVPLSEISPWVIHATVSTEDETFYENPGFSIYSILRAVYRNTTTGGLGGGASTITQQITRALVLDPELAQQRTNTRKIQEIIVAAEISRQYTKNEILEFYLNEIYYGNRAYGIEAAAQTYFGKSAKDLNIAEAAFLAGLPQSPATYDPVQNREIALARMDDVLRLMTEANGTGCIQMQHEPYNTEPLCVTREQLENDYAVQIAEVKIKVFQAPTYEVKYPHFVNYVWQDLEETYGAQRIYSSGFQVYTTLIPSVQDAAQAAVDFQLRPGFTPNANNASVVAMRPSDGAVMAMVGSADFYNEDIDGQVNVAFSMQQPGSAIKPLVYLTALEGFDGQYWYPGTVIWDVPSNFNGYTPRNYSGTFNGPVSMRYSIGQSLNIPAVKTLAYVTPQRFTDLLDRLEVRLPGETPVEAGLPSALGAVDVYLFDMVRAYGALANNGVLVEPYAITRILDRNDNEVYVAETNPQGVQVIRPEYAYLITDILADPSVRFSTELNLPGWRAAGKTGTTNDVRDVWTIGYTPDVVVGVWVGRTDNQPLGPGVTSGNTAAPIWQQVMTAALSNITPRDFARPDGIIDVQVCADSGALFNPATCPSGNAVSEIAYVNQPPPNEGFVRTLEVDSFSGLLANEYCPEYVETRSFINIDDPSAIAWLNGDPAGQAWAAAREIQIPLTTPPTDSCQPGQPRPSLTITSPASGQEVSGLIEIRGSVSVPDFASYQFYVANLDTAPDEFVGPLAQYQTQQSAPNSLLGVVELTNFPNGNYVLRLEGQSRSGAKAHTDVTILINNVQVLPTAAPTFTPPPSVTDPSLLLTPTATP